MPRSRYKLTEKIVAAITKPGLHPDGARLYLQVSATGTKSWVWRYTLKGRTREMGLGALADVGLTAARARVDELRPLLAKGIDPIEAARLEAIVEPQPQEPVPTFEEFAREWVKARVTGWENAKHRYQWLRTLEMYAFPLIGHLAVDAIGTQQVLIVIEPIWAAIPETAMRLRGRIERILAAAAVRGHRPATNPATWRGHLKEVLPAQRPGGNYPSMPYRELPAFMARLIARGNLGDHAARFSILTAARPGEARGARWPEIDEQERLWNVPAERMKERRPHTVPLCDEALAVLDAVRPLRNLGGQFLFPGKDPRKPITDMTMTKLMRDSGLPFTVHGFRATFKTWAEEESRHPNVVIEAALAHLVGDKAEQAYMRGERLAKRRALMDEWGAFCLSTPASTVVPMRALG